MSGSPADTLDYDALKERLIDLQLARKQVQRELQLAAILDGNAPCAPQRSQHTHCCSGAHQAVPKQRTGLYERARENMAVRPRPTKSASAPKKNESPMKPARTVAIARSGSKAGLYDARGRLTVERKAPSSVPVTACHILTHLGSPFRISVQIGLQTAGATLALMREEHRPTNECAQISVEAARAVRLLTTIGYVDSIIEGATRELKLDPLTSEMADQMRKLVYDKDQQGSCNDISLPLLSSQVACLFLSGKPLFQNSEEQSLHIETIDLHQVRVALIECVRTWTSCKSMRLSESALLALREIIANSANNWSPVLIMSVLTCGYNISRKQGLSLSRATMCIAILEQVLGHPPKQNDTEALESDDKSSTLEYKFACVAASAAIDDFWNRYRTIAATAKDPRMFESFKQPVEPNVLTESVANFPGDLGDRLRCAAASLSRVATLLKDAKAHEVLQSARSSTAISYMLSSAHRTYRDQPKDRLPIDFLFHLYADLSQHRPASPRSQTHGSDATLAVPVAREPSSSAKAAPAEAQRGEAEQVQSSRLPNRIFDDWTSESSSSWLSDSSEQSHDEAYRAFTARLNDARALASRYGLLQTTHPDDVLRLMESLPPPQ